MKGPNPFAPWNADPAGICGRKEEAKAFSSFANATASKQGGVLLVVGGPGSGKSALLWYFRAEAEKAGLLAPFVKADRNEGMDSLAGKVRGELASVAETGGAPVRALAKASPRQASPEVGMEGIAEEGVRAARKHFGAIIFIDDLDCMRKPDEALKTILKSAEAGWGKRNLSFVVSSTRGFGADSQILRRMELNPFGEHDARELVEKALKKGPPKMGEECLQSILQDSGGNPRLIKTVCYGIYDKLRDSEKVITKGHYLAYLPQIMGTISREWFGGMYQETPPAERDILHALAKEEDGAHVSDIARMAGKKMGPTTALIGRLLGRGQIIKVARGKYRVFSRLYGRYVAQRA
ncbi:ATP-binding protein [Candidatus Micrarchaeota archaeon]|nr:ATP-binding protein [Candidatus Micrarchaeota archaeon]